MAKIRKRTWTTAKGEMRTAWSVNIEGAGNRARRQFATRREADAYRVEVEHQLRLGTFRPEADKVTMGEVAELFLTYCHGRMTRGERMTRANYNTYEGHVRNYICPDPKRHARRTRPPRLRSFKDGLTARTLAQLTTGAIEKFCEDLRQAEVSVPTTRKILGTLKLVLRHAVSRDLVATNVARGVKVIGRRDEGSKKVVPPSKEAMRQLLEVADDDFRVVLIVASATGVRAGELHALRWRHVDFEKGEVKIETRVDAFGEEDVTKTHAGMRTVPIAPQVVTVLKAWKLRSKRKKQQDLLFPNKRGVYTNHDNMVKRKFVPLFETLERLHKEEPAQYLEPPKRFNWHALRHFAISCWIEAGLSPKTVQTFAGHSSLQVTMDRYGHLFRSEDHAMAMEAIARQLY